MNATFSPPVSWSDPPIGTALKSMGRRLRDVLFLHLDLWPWGMAAGSNVRMQTDFGNGRPGGNDLPPQDSDEPVSLNRFQHETVLLHEAISYLHPAPGKLLIDCTLGGGGHTEAMLRAGADVVGFDQDATAIEAASQRLAGYDEHFVALRLNFRHIREVLEETGVMRVDGIMADLGASSPQFDVAERGFSFQQDGPLDMRMNKDAPRTAADVVNETPLEQLQHIFREYGEEPLARRAAMAIVRRREKRPFHRTLDLAETLASSLPRRGKNHPATRVFQALRIEVNDELGALEDLLAAAPHILKPAGRMVLLCFHSLESRLVKRAFQRYSTEWCDRPEWPEPRKNPEHCMKLLTNKPVEPSPEEIARNPRARSASLRAAERLPL